MRTIIPIALNMHLLVFVWENKKSWKYVTLLGKIFIHFKFFLNYLKFWLSQINLINKLCMLITNDPIKKSRTHLKCFFFLEILHVSSFYFLPIIVLIPQQVVIYAHQLRTFPDDHNLGISNDIIQNFLSPSVSLIDNYILLTPRVMCYICDRLIMVLNGLTLCLVLCYNHKMWIQNVKIGS